MLPHSPPNTGTVILQYLTSEVYLTMFYSDGGGSSSVHGKEGCHSLNKPKSENLCGANRQVVNSCFEVGPMRSPTCVLW